MSIKSEDFGSANLGFIEQLYAAYLQNPPSVPADWRDLFAGWAREDDRPPVEYAFQPRSIFNPSSAARTASGSNEVEVAVRQERVDQLVRAYRVRGHMLADLDPLGRPRSATNPELELSTYGLTEADLDRACASRAFLGSPVRTVREVLERLRNTYCRFIGVQFMHIDDPQVRNWLQSRMESTENRLTLSREDQLRILTHLTDAVIFEEFLKKKFVGSKSFSLEGSESLIPLLDMAIEKSAEQNVEHVVMGMAHRGRLNVLANIVGKSPRLIFREFEDADAERYIGGGDVKYHLGHHSTFVTARGKQVGLSLAFNPSHLEFVNTVVLGRVRAQQDRLNDLNREKVLGLLIHGDAAFAGEGIVQETLNLSQLEAYRTGGTLHIVVNNQIGFTTTPEEGRSTLYATDVAKMLQSPIFHVNGENPEAVAQVVDLAMDFRRTFRRDVVIDLYCYRRRGHNETDEPAFTQPVMYKAIGNRENVREGYLNHLLQLGGISREDADRIADARRELLEHELSARTQPPTHVPTSAVGQLWRTYAGGYDHECPDVPTRVDKRRLSELLEAQTRLPADFHPHPKAKRILEERLEMAAGKRPLDWSAAESLAFASVAVEGFRVRLSGQDSGRGTFSQRHAVLYDYENGRTYTPLQHVAPGQAPVDIYNSPLSEAGVLGFEYGYSIGFPDGLTLWEAQFGDFVNAAQVIIDQFICSAEDKWHRLNGLVLLLPHGLEGQGPEHSSARLERFLELAAEDNIQIVYPTTPAQYFHVLRRQVVRKWRKPLIIMTPKSLLRHKRSVSTLDELAQGQFQRIIPDPAPAKRTSRVLICSGKLYFDLLEARDARALNDVVSIVRIEQLYPLQDEHLASALSAYRVEAEACWVQEEPENMGAWRFLRARYGESLFGRPFRVVSRPASASPATGSHASHKLEQQRLLDEAFAGLSADVKPAKVKINA